MRLILIIIVAVSTNIQAQKSFRIDTDLLIANYDSKPDVDDLMSVAAFATILHDDRMENLNFISVAGAYGTQGGSFIDAANLFNLSFDNKWVNAHLNRSKAVDVVFQSAMKILQNGGSVWIAEAGQSDVSADLLEAIKATDPTINTKERINIVQHSWWNESVTTPEKLLYVRDYTNYIKIPDGNGEGNGTPGFRTSDGNWWDRVLADEKVGEIWKEAQRLSIEYNVVAGYDNEAIGAGGFDFSDTSEICWILGFNYLKDVNEFFGEFLNE